MNKAKTVNTMPEIGQEATLIMYTDRHAYTVISATASGKTIKAQRDTAIRIDANGMSDVQDYSYEANPSAEVETFRLSSDGFYYGKAGKLALGYRREYYDFSF